MTRWTDLSQHQRRVAEAAFTALSVGDALAEAAAPEIDDTDQPDAAEPRTNADSRPVGPGEVYAYACGTASHPSIERVEAAAARSPAVSDMLWRMLDRIATLSAPRVAAASTGEIEERQGDGFVLRVRGSRARPEQVYILIVLDDPANAPEYMFLRRADGDVVRHPLPAPSYDTIQILAARDGDLATALNDPASEVRLK